MEIRKCKACGFILGTRPNSKDVGGVCLACLNKDRKNNINWKERQNWLTKYLEEKKDASRKYDVAVGVSGGKDSSAIVKRLIDNHGVKPDRMLLIHLKDDFTPSEAGLHNLDNIQRHYDLDMVELSFSPKTFAEESKKDFLNELHPLKWFENEINGKTQEIAKAFGIPTVFMGENPKFEYGEVEECEIFHPASDDVTQSIYMGAIYPYSNSDSLEQALQMGFKTLDDFDDWMRQGSADPYTQIDSKGYMFHHWCKFIKFGFQRVSDLACRFVREGKLSKAQAEQLIKDTDWILDPLAKKDYMRTTGLTEEEFQNTIDRFANKDILVKDANGNWRRKDLI